MHRFAHCQIPFILIMYGYSIYIWHDRKIGNMLHMWHTGNYPLIIFCYGSNGMLYGAIMYTRWLLRFEFQLPHLILSPAMATEKNWPLSQFHISYQNSEIIWPKVPISDFQSQLSMSKIIQNFQNRISLKNITLWAHFFVIDIFGKIQFLKHFI